MAYAPQAEIKETSDEAKAILSSLRALSNRLALAFDPQGRMRVNTDQIGGATTLPVTGPLTSAQTLTGLTTVSTVTALANLAPAGVVNPSQFLLNPLAAMGLRDRIIVS